MHSRKNSQGGEPVSRTPPGRTEASSVGPGDDGVPLPEFPPKGAVSDAIAIPPQRDVVPGPETNVGSRELIERLAMVSASAWLAQHMAGDEMRDDKLFVLQMELAAKEAKERRATAGATSFPDLGLLGTHDAASTPGSTAPRSAGQSALLQSLPPRSGTRLPFACTRGTRGGAVTSDYAHACHACRHAKSNMDLSQLLPENMPDANKDVISPYELSMMRQSQAQSQQGFSFAGPIHHGNMPQEGDPGHAKHPGNYTPNQGPSPTISARQGGSTALSIPRKQPAWHEHLPRSPSHAAHPTWSSCNGRSPLTPCSTEGQPKTSPLRRDRDHIKHSSMGVLTRGKEPVNPRHHLPRPLSTTTGHLSLPFSALPYALSDGGLTIAHTRCSTSALICTYSGNLSSTVCATSMAFTACPAFI